MRQLAKCTLWSLDRLYRILKELENVDAYEHSNSLSNSIVEGFYDDLNTPKIIAELNILCNQISSANHTKKAEIKFNLLEIGKILGILQENPEKWLGYGKSENLDKTMIERLIKDRNEARRNKNFDMADKIRNELIKTGIEIEDTSSGTIWRKI